MDRDALLSAIVDRLEAEDRVRAAWLTGSLARGEADRFSDLDLWVVADASDRDRLTEEWPRLCDAIAPVVLNQRVGALPVFNAVTEDWLRFDVSFGTPEEVPRRTRSTLKLLFDKDGLHARLRERGEPLRPDPTRIEELTVEFFRVLGLLPVVIGRQEYVVGVSGAGILRTLLTRLLLEDVAVEDRGGALRLAPLLPPDRLRILAELPAPTAERESVLDAHEACARAFLPSARELAARAGASWPHRLENACLAHLDRELGLRLE